MSLAESRGSASGGVWGNAPTVIRALNSKKATYKGAGSEASLPVTLRIRRCAPQAALPTNSTLSRQMGATDLPPKTPNAEHSIHSCIPALFVKQTYSITIQTYVVPSAIVYSRMLLAG